MKYQEAINNGFASQHNAAPPKINPIDPNKKTIIESLHVVVVQYAFWVNDNSNKLAPAILIFLCQLSMFIFYYLMRALLFHFRRFLYIN